VVLLPFVAKQDFLAAKDSLKYNSVVIFVCEEWFFCSRDTLLLEISVFLVDVLVKLTFCINLFAITAVNFSQDVALNIAHLIRLHVKIFCQELTLMIGEAHSTEVYREETP